jgi:pyridoxal phosphate enzyme (YggS family)
MDSNIKPILQRNLEAIHAAMGAACARVDRSPNDVTLVCVTKYVDTSVVSALHELGVKDFGESRPQVLWEKGPKLPGDCRWHMIGHWQMNKVRRALPFVSMVHSIDRMELAELLSSEAVRLGRVIPALIEVKLVGDEAKHGFSPTEIREEIEHLNRLPGLSLRGLMCMASLEASPEACRSTFRELRLLRDELNRTHPTMTAFRSLSMGMSDDFEIAIEEGATHVRVGSRLFEGTDA